MGYDPYKAGQFTKSPYYSKTDLSARLVATLQVAFDKRGLQLISQPSRCICKHQIHELVGTDEEGVVPGSTVEKVAYLGFMEITEGGIILAGDELWYEDRLLGHILGFDETHMPNHYNIVVHIPERKTGLEQGLVPGAKMKIKHVKVEA